ncbi:hypothetical protein CHS0354_029514 [Potamilus streckersoni]|uniref:RING-type domain-containing protein n=1 Tax=Potamilus streckersoni TaxID=2493646 RepID=A0AAE0T1P4_9BIVA|nr:hypothetical protein CHS0354_029514 [Potamilus streckersoni]
MATALTTQEGIAQMLKCPLCLKTFKKPKFLPCGHTYCATCLQLHINQVTRAETIHTSFCCPVCTANIVPKDDKVDSSQWIESFPLNSMLASLLEITMEKKGRQYCNTCLKRNRQRRAICYCEDCSRSMCDTCSEYHEDLSGTG